jgi:hypothetical protein
MLVAVLTIIIDSQLALLAPKLLCLLITVYKSARADRFLTFVKSLELVD